MSDEYHAYLLRLWRIEDDGGRWRARLENVETGEAQGFASLDQLIEFLHRLEAVLPPGNDASQGMVSN